MIEYNIPTKDKPIKSYAVTLFNDLTYASNKKVKEQINLIDYIHNKLENTDDSVGSEKWKNTLEFLYHVKDD